MDHSLPSQPEAQRAIDLAYGALARRERTVSELRSFLERKRVEPEAIESAVAALTRAGYLDDVRYALRFAEDKRALERWGGERISQELHRRGVPQDAVEAALAAQDHDADLAAALELLRARAPDPPIDDRARDRAWRLLVRRGYSPELAYDAVRAHEHGAQ